MDIRICDLIVDPIALLAITAFLEARLHQMLENPGLDPLKQSSFSSENLIAIADKNESLVAGDSLDAELIHWEDGRRITARRWIEELYQEVFPFAKQRGYSCFLMPLKKILSSGNTAQKWLKMYNQEQDIPSVIQQAIQATAQQEKDLESKLCQPILVA